MKKACLLFLCLAALLLTACGKTPETDVSATSESDSVTQEEEPVTAQDLLSANDSYGVSTKYGSVSVRDESVRFRTEDSYRLEPIAIRAAEEMLRGSMNQTDSLQIRDCVVSNCADDGENTYFDVSFSFSYVVAFDQRIDNAKLYSVGVRKADETAFDSSGDIARVLRRYSIFQKSERDHVCLPDANDPDLYASAAKEIALSHLKNTESGMALSARECPDVSGNSFSAWEVLCEGENDFGMRIPDVYTVYLAYDGDRIIEIDPAEPSINNF